MAPQLFGSFMVLLALMPADGETTVATAPAVVVPLQNECTAGADKPFLRRIFDECLDLCPGSFGPIETAEMIFVPNDDDDVPGAIVNLCRNLQDVLCPPTTHKSKCKPLIDAANTCGVPIPGSLTAAYHMCDITTTTTQVGPPHTKRCATGQFFPKTLRIFSQCGQCLDSCPRSCGPIETTGKTLLSNNTPTMLLPSNSDVEGAIAQLSRSLEDVLCRLTNHKDKCKPLIDVANTWNLPTPGSVMAAYQMCCITKLRRCPNQAAQAEQQPTNKLTEEVKFATANGSAWNITSTGLPQSGGGSIRRSYGGTTTNKPTERVKFAMGFSVANLNDAKTMAASQLVKNAMDQMMAEQLSVPKNNVIASQSASA